MTLLRRVALKRWLLIWTLELTIGIVLNALMMSLLLLLLLSVVRHLLDNVLSLITPLLKGGGRGLLPLSDIVGSICPLLNQLGGLKVRCLAKVAMLVMVLSMSSLSYVRLTSRLLRVRSLTEVGIGGGRLVPVLPWLSLLTGCWQFVLLVSAWLFDRLLQQSLPRKLLSVS